MAQTRPQPVIIDTQAISDLSDYCRHRQISKLLLVADRNTYKVQGQAVEAALKENGADLKTVVFTSSEVIADAHHILQVLIAADREPRTYLAVGSGTITDITRFVSHRTGCRFISVPTAPSVDGFASLGAPLMIGGVKTTLLTQAPAAIFADLGTLAAAPRAMIAAGFGDMLGKYTSIADWRLGHLLWDEPYDESIAQRTLNAVQRCAGDATAIGETSSAGIRILMEGLIESGYCMLDFGSSRPASGAEHHYSHYWEMQLLQEGRPAILHGAKVGVATILVAQLYDQIKQLSRAEVADLLAASQWPAREQEIAQIQAAYGRELAPQIVDAQKPFLNLSQERYGVLKEKILAHWADIIDIASQVPSGQEIAGYLNQVGGPTDVSTLGLTSEEQARAEQNGHYLRQRFTVRKLTRLGAGVTPTYHDARQETD